MSDRVNFYFRQRVTEAELDSAFEQLEDADRNFAADIGVYGIISGAVPSPHSPVADLSIDLTSPGRAYDNLGQRIFFGTGQTVDCSVDVSGLPTDVAAASNVRWLSVFLRFTRALSDERTDGNSQKVYFERDEAFELVLRQAPEGPSGGAARVALQPDELLICDVLRRPGQTQITASDIDTTRRQAFIFAEGTSVSVDTGLWTILRPTVKTAQSALDEVDAELTEHFSATGRRHPASAIDAKPSSFITATTVQGFIDELLGDLSRTADGNSGAHHIGTAAIAGTPNGLSAGSIQFQLALLLEAINTHQGAVTNAHNASTVAAAPFGILSATNVQAQLQELVNDLAATATGAAGSQYVGSEKLDGFPNVLTAGAVKDQLSTLLGLINTHVTQYNNAHSAVNISLADYASQVSAIDVENALAEIFSAFTGDHQSPSDPTSGQHKTIRQPNLGGTKALLWDALGNGGANARFRVYADTNSIWFTANAAWDGSSWTKDNTASSAGYRFSSYDFELFYQSSSSATFTTFERRWKLPMSLATNSAFEMTGAMQEEGRLALGWSNSGSNTIEVAAAGSCTFRNRFAATPSSITLSVNYHTAGSTVPSVVSATRDGFGYYGFRPLAAGAYGFWMGSYTATA